jgi:hypothetical protein
MVSHDDEVKHPQPPYQDPTKNVLDKVASEMRRQDDLRNAESRRVDEQAALRAEHIKEISALRTVHSEDSARHHREMADKESERLDAIRLVDQSNVETARREAVQSAAVLSEAVTKSAETLRINGAVTEANLRELITSTTNTLAVRLASVEKAQYEGVGKGLVTDPAFAQLFAEVKGLREVRSAGSGMKELWQLLLAAAVGAAALYVAFGKHI